MTNIAKLRLQAGLTQMAISETLKIDRSTVAKWESGEANPRADKLPALAELLGCAIDDLFAANDKTNPSA